MGSGGIRATVPPVILPLQSNEQEIINLMDRKDLSVFFLESHKLPVNNIFS